MEEVEFEESIIESIFSEAKKKDEFEFCCTLLRVKGLQDAGWDTLEESYKLVTQVLSLISAPVESTFKMRMLLLLYCHITEMNDFYSIPANLLRIIVGERYVMDPFFSKLFQDNKPSTNPEAKMKRIKELALNAMQPSIGEIYDFLLVRPIRNAFSHSDYTIYNNEIRLASGESVLINNVYTRVVPFEWLLPRVNITINIALQIMHLITEHRNSYKVNKKLKGRIGHNDTYLEVELQSNGSTLTGFSSC